ncbi:OmpH family outer membrane protein [Phaeovulum sp.]|uniref:OmpH family outer membrane protein n=1 Tax=Phaeovulum sp. TaxID=2934796 RepID=UPI0039E3F498
MRACFTLTLMGVMAAGAVGAQTSDTAIASEGVTGTNIQAQAGEDGVILVPSPILTLDWERLYDSSLWGARVKTDMEAASTQLKAENTRISEGLVAEEKSLTERRSTMTPEAFRAEADAFDARVTDIRDAQEAKAHALSRRLDEERQAFISAAFPLLDEVLQARRAVAILDRRVIIRGAKDIDVTADLGARVDAALGDGRKPAPETPSTQAPGTDN